MKVNYFDDFKKQQDAFDKINEGIKDIPTEVAFYHISAKVIKGLQTDSFNYGTLSEIKGMLEDLQEGLNRSIMRQPSKIGQALGMNIIDVEEHEIIEVSSFGR